MFTHIYIEVLYRGRWVPLDATMPYPMGWAPRAPVRKVIPLERLGSAAIDETSHGQDLTKSDGTEGRNDQRIDGLPSDLSSDLGADHGPAVLAGTRLYRTFNRFRPARVVRLRHRRVIPPVVVELGTLTGLMYRSDKWQRGRPRTFIHFMEDPPRLVCNAAGTQLYVVGGRYRVTARGIEG